MKKIKLSLMSAIPCSRIDLQPCCRDGRGGWVYSQCDPCRRFDRFDEESGLYFALSVFSDNIDATDGIEQTDLIAYKNGTEIGTSTLSWLECNSWGKHLKDGAVYSWPQFINIQPESDGIVEVKIFVKLRSQAAAIEVPQKAICHVRKETSEVKQLPAWRFFFRKLMGLSILLTKRRLKKK